MTTARLTISLLYSVAVVALVIVPPPGPTIHPQVSGPPILSTVLAAQVLRDASEFSAAQVGFGGFTPPEVLAWRVVLHSDQADSIFQALITTGTPATELYGLAGLQFLLQFRNGDSSFYRAALWRLERSSELVRTQIGCIGSASPMKRLAREVDRGSWTREFLAGRLLGLH